MLLVSTNGTARQLQWSLDGVPAGAICRYAVAAGAALDCDFDADGTNDSAQLQTAIDQLTAPGQVLLLEGTYRQWYHFDLETRSDLGYSQAGWLEFAQYPKFILYNYAWLYEVWGDNFKGIHIANKIIKKVPGIDMDENLKKR